jgi:hypothetical protein
MIQQNGFNNFYQLPNYMSNTPNNKMQSDLQQLSEKPKKIPNEYDNILITNELNKDDMK